MDTLTSISQKLAPLNLYDISEGKNIYYEICAYSCALDRHKENLERVLKECFISSAETYGIENTEKVIGSVRSDYSTEDRRKMLIIRKTFGDNDFTKSKFQNFLSSIGVYNYDVLEMPWESEMNICIDGSYNRDDKAWIIKEIKLALPAHLNCNVYFSGIEWADIDSKNLTYSLMDNYDYTWSQINRLEKKG